MITGPPVLISVMICLHIHRSFLKSSGKFASYANLNTLTSAESLLTVNQNVSLISASTNIFENLALEDWIYTRCTFAPGACLLLSWRDTPCVVIGRHQNPWTEVNVRACQRLGVQIARRNSGGGTVYHDLGNINFSFITNRQDYDRKKNLMMIRDFLFHNHGIESEISPREDLVTSNMKLKISGTASKLARINAYHHCTLLVQADVNKMRATIRKESPAVTMSRATSSVRSDITNLSSLVKEMDTKAIMQQVADLHSSSVSQVTPANHIFESLSDSTAKLLSWDWVFGKTPRFVAQIEYNESVDPIVLTIHVSYGLIEEAKVTTDVREITDMTLVGCKFIREEVQEKLLLWSLSEDDHLLTCNICKAAETLFDRVT